MSFPYPTSGAPGWHEAVDREYSEGASDTALGLFRRWRISSNTFTSIARLMRESGQTTASLCRLPVREGN